MTIIRHKPCRRKNLVRKTTLEPCVTKNGLGTIAESETPHWLPIKEKTQPSLRFGELAQGTRLRPWPRRKATKIRGGGVVGGGGGNKRQKPCSTELRRARTCLAARNDRREVWGDRPDKQAQRVTGPRPRTSRCSDGRAPAVGTSAPYQQRGKNWQGVLLRYARRGKRRQIRKFGRPTPDGKVTRHFAAVPRVQARRRRSRDAFADEEMGWRLRGRGWGTLASGAFYHARNRMSVTDRKLVIRANEHGLTPPNVKRARAHLRAAATARDTLPSSPRGPGAWAATPSVKGLRNAAADKRLRPHHRTPPRVTDP